VNRKQSWKQELERIERELLEKSIERKHREACDCLERRDSFGQLTPCDGLERALEDAE